MTEFTQHRLRSTVSLALVVPLLWTSVCQQAAVVAADRPSETRPNIVLMMADDIGYECFGCYGSQQYRTPHLDRLAARGMRFTHCYAQPLCTPSRVKIMTGLSNVRNYSAFSILNRDQRTIGQYFQELGYETVVAGKWQLLGAEHYAKRFREQGSWPRDTGFDRHCLWQVDKKGSRYWNPLLHIDGKNQQFTDDDYGPDICAEFILDFLRRPHDRPFFVYYPMILVHNPFEPTPDSASRSTRNSQQNFQDMVQYMDKIVGRIAHQLDDSGMSENTLLLFVGDNGTNRAITSVLNGQTIQGGKGLTTDAGTRVALIAHQPGTIPAGAVCDDLVDFSDFLPTLLSAARADISPALDGQSFWPQLGGKVGKPRESIFCYYCPRPERTDPIRFARDDRWKLYADGRFFDVRNDPLEQHALNLDALNPDALNLDALNPDALNPDALNLDALVSVATTARQKLSATLKAMPSTGQTLLRFQSPLGAENGFK